MLPFGPGMGGRGPAAPSRARDDGRTQSVQTVRRGAVKKYRRRADSLIYDGCYISRYITHVTSTRAARTAPRSSTTASAACAPAAGTHASLPSLDRRAGSRADTLASARGQVKPPMPNLEKLARDGASFVHAYNQSPHRAGEDLRFCGQSTPLSRHQLERGKRQTNRFNRSRRGSSAVPHISTHRHIQHTADSHRGPPVLRPNVTG